MFSIILECEGSPREISDISSPSSLIKLSRIEDYLIREKFLFLSLFLLQMIKDFDIELLR